MALPEIEQGHLYHLLKSGNIEEFNRRRDTGATCNLRGVDLQHTDLRGLVTAGLDLGDCCLRNADLRELDLRETNLEGASISGAKISGTYFPKTLSAEEINLSLLHGTRLRYR